MSKPEIVDASEITEPMIEYAENDLGMSRHGWDDLSPESVVAACVNAYLQVKNDNQ